MIRYFSTIVAASVAFFLVGEHAEASLVANFSLESSAGGTVFGPGKQYSQITTGLMADGVTFDVTLMAVGSGMPNRDAVGLGVNGSGQGAQNLNESLAFSLAISNEVGGAISFDGFQSVTFAMFGLTDAASIYTGPGRTGLVTSVTGLNPLVDLSGVSPNSFVVFGDAGASFFTGDVSARFSGATAVPEPSSLACLALATVAGGVQMRRRKKPEATF